MAVDRFTLDLKKEDGAPIPGTVVRRINAEIRNFAVGVINSELDSEHRAEAEEITVEHHVHNGADGYCRHEIAQAEDGEA